MIILHDRLRVFVPAHHLHLPIGETLIERAGDGRPPQVMRREFAHTCELAPLPWLGWLKAAETLAFHTLIHTGRRGIGLPHEQLMNLLDERKVGGETRESLSSQLRRLYHLPVSDELDLLNQLKAAGLLLRGRRWSFAHDTFEEFFAASYLVSHIASHFDLTEEWPSLDKWQESQELEQGFSYVLEFVREMIDEADKERLMRVDLPQSWRECLTATPDNGTQR